MLNAIPIDPAIPLLIHGPRRPLDSRVEITKHGLPDVIEAVCDVREDGVGAGFLAVVVDADQRGGCVRVHFPEFEADHVLLRVMNRLGDLRCSLNEEMAGRQDRKEKLKLPEREMQVGGALFKGEREREDEKRG